MGNEFKKEERRGEVEEHRRVERRGKKGGVGGELKEIILLSDSQKGVNSRQLLPTLN